MTILKTSTHISMSITLTLFVNCKPKNSNPKFDLGENILNNGKKMELFEGTVLHRVYLLSGPDLPQSQSLHLSGQNDNFEDYALLAAGALGIAVGGMIVRDILHVPKKNASEPSDYDFKTNREKKSDVLARSEIKKHEKLDPEFEKNITDITEQSEIIKRENPNPEIEKSKIDITEHPEIRRPKTDEVEIADDSMLTQKTTVTPVSAEKFLKLAGKVHSGTDLEAIIGKESPLYRYFDKAVEQDIVAIGLNRFEIKKIVSDENGAIEKVLVKKIRTNLIEKISKSDPVNRKHKKDWWTPRSFRKLY